MPFVMAVDTEPQCHARGARTRGVREWGGVDSGGARPHLPPTVMPPDDAFAPNGASDPAPLEVSSAQAKEPDTAAEPDPTEPPSASPQPDEPSAAMVPAGAFPAPSHV